MKSWIIPVLDLFFFDGKDRSILRKKNKVYNGPGLTNLTSNRRT